MKLQKTIEQEHLYSIKEMERINRRISNKLDIEGANWLRIKNSLDKVSDKMNLLKKSFSDNRKHIEKLKKLL